MCPYALADHHNHALITNARVSMAQKPAWHKDKCDAAAREYPRQTGGSQLHELKISPWILGILHIELIGFRVRNAS